MQENVQLNVEMQGLDVMKKQFRELQEQMTAAGAAGDKELFTKLAAKAGELKNDTKDLQAYMRALDPGELLNNYVKLAQGAMGAFEGITGAMTLVIGDSKALEEAQKKAAVVIKTMMALEQARAAFLDPAGKAVLKATYMQTAALLEQAAAWALANPFMAAGILLGAGLAAAGVAIYKSFSDGEESMKLFTATLNKINSASVDDLNITLNETSKRLYGLSQDAKLANGEITKATYDANKSIITSNEDLSTKTGIIYAAKAKRTKDIEAAAATQIKDLQENLSLTSVDRLAKMAKVEANAKAALIVNEKNYGKQINAIIGVSVAEAKAIKKQAEDDTKKENESKYKEYLSNLKTYLSEQYSLEVANIESSYSAKETSEEASLAMKKELIAKETAYTKQQYKNGIINATEYKTKIAQLNNKTNELTKEEIILLGKKAQAEADAFQAELDNADVMLKARIEEYDQTVELERSKIELKYAAADNTKAKDKELLDLEFAALESHKAMMIDKNTFDENAEEQYNIKYNLLLAKRTAATKTEADKQADIQKQANEVLVQAAQASYDLITQIVSTSYDNQLARAEDRYSGEQEKLDKQLKNKTISQEQYDKKTEKLNKDKATEEAKIKTNQAKAAKSAAEIQIVIDTAMAVMKTYSTTGFPLGIPLAIAQAALGAVQLATVAAQPIPKFATGGLISGPGTGTSDSITARVSAGEYVVNAASTEKNKPAIEAINNGSYDLASEIGKQIRANMFIVNNVSDTSKIQNKTNRIQNIANL